MNNSFNVQSVDVEGVINSTAYAVKVTFAESDIKQLVIVPKEADAPLPTNYETILDDTQRTVVNHHVQDARSFTHSISHPHGVIIERGEWEI